jgi:dolichyl-phosphate beta-glucosyltransferase
VNEESRPYLTIVVPAYNEEHRLPSALRSIHSYLEQQPYTGEVIVVDDGSIDATISSVRSVESQVGPIRLLELPHRGKAAAVRAGMLEARGQLVLFTDADLSTPLSFIEQLSQAIEAGADVAIGSREGKGARRLGEPGYRHVMGRVFNAVVRAIAVPGINDTQCGFKMFRHRVAQDVFSSLRLYDGSQEVTGPRVTGFDVEVLFVSRKRGYDIVEIPVQWRHVPGSKVAPLSDSVRMFADVIRVRLNDLRGRYTSPEVRVIDDAR